MAVGLNKTLKEWFRNKRVVTDGNGGYAQLLLLRHTLIESSMISSLRDYKNYSSIAVKRNNHWHVASTWTTKPISYFKECNTSGLEA